MTMQIIRPAYDTIAEAAAVLTSSNVAEADYTAWSATTAYTTTGTAGRVMIASEHKIYEPVKVSSVSTVTITIASPGVVSWPAHGFADGTPISFATTTGGALPTGITAGVEYYVKSPAADTFNISATVGGAAINTSGSQSGTHTATAKSNYNRNPATNSSGSSPFWQEVSATNKFKMLDTSSTTQTENATIIDVTLTPGRVDSLYLGGLDAASYEVTQVDSGNTVYSKTEDLQLENVFNWQEYFFEPIIRKTDVFLDDLPIYGGSTIQVKVNQPGGTAKCGSLIVGLKRELGTMLWQPRVRILDYSRKDTDSFGNTTLTKRRNAKLLSCELFVENELIDEVRRLMAEYAATVLVWAGEKDFSSTIVLGFLRDFEGVIDSPAGSFVNLEIEGLT